MFQLKNVIVCCTLLIVTSLSAADQNTVLLPLGVFTTSGAFGSLWQTELAVKNASGAAVEIDHVGITCVVTCPFPPLELSPGKAGTIKNEVVNDTALGSSSGILMHVTSRDLVSADDVRFNFRVRDLSRETVGLGTELPVVRMDQFREAVHLLNIPVSPMFRVTLRMYAVTDNNVPVPVVLRIFDFATGEKLVEQSISLSRSVGQSPTWFPAFAQIDSPSGSFLGLTASRVNVEVAAVQSKQNVWAFASVTNNESQQITTITPQ